MRMAAEEAEQQRGISGYEAGACTRMAAEEAGENSSITGICTCAQPAGGGKPGN